MRVNGYLTVTGILAGIMAIVHILRLWYGWTASVGTWEVPVEFSWSTAVIGGAISIWSIVLLRGRS